MLTPGDVAELDLGPPAGSEAGLIRPAVIVTAEQILSGGPKVVQVVPRTRTIRDSGAEIVIDPTNITASAIFPRHTASTAALWPQQGSDVDSGMSVPSYSVRFGKRWFS